MKLQFTQLLHKFAVVGFRSAFYVQNLIMLGKQKRLPVHSDRDVIGIGF